MILSWLILSLLLCGSLAWLTGRWHSDLPRWVSLITVCIHLACIVAIWTGSVQLPGAGEGTRWYAVYERPWIPEFGASIHLGLDGLGLLLIVLTDLLGIMAILASWEEITLRSGFFHFNVLAILAALTGVFLALDLLLFYVCWEVMLVPLYLLIAIWGHERRLYAAMKFFIFTQASGLLMLLAIVGLYFLRGQASGTYSFDYLEQLELATTDPGWTRFTFCLMLGFCAAFAVKLPTVPWHTWLPDAHTEAPTAGSVILAGLVLKAGAFGFFRFMLPLFPAESQLLTPYALTLALVGILYGGLVAFGQTDLKRLVAYTSVSHMGFVLLGIFAWNQLAWQGAVLVMISHGISTGALFVLVGGLQHRLGSRELSRMGGLWSIMPRMGGWSMVFAMASLGLPAVGNFVGEFLVLLGTYQTRPAFAAVATLGFVVATAYSLAMMQGVFFGPCRQAEHVADSTRRENLIMVTMTVTILTLGLFPQAVLDTSEPTMTEVRQRVDQMAPDRHSAFNGSTRTGHADSISAMAPHNDGRRIVSDGNENGEEIDVDSQGGIP